MRPPPYHLRPNKTADRFALIEAIKRLEKLDDGSLNDYTYYGLGGPYLEDFRLLYDFCPDIGMVSIEIDDEVYKRQKFHLPCETLKLEPADVSSFIAQFDLSEKKSIFWLDYTGLEFSFFEDFKALLSIVAEDSMVKVTLRSEPRDYWVLRPASLKRRKAAEFRAKFATVMPDPSADPPRELQDFAYLLQEMLQIAALQALPPSATTWTFVPVSSFYYADGAGIFTLTGVVCESARKAEVERVFSDWEFANLTWGLPKLIDVPILSTKERLHLQALLPSGVGAGTKLRKHLDYLIDEDIEKTEAALEQYAAFHRYSPYVLRGVP